MPRAKVAPSLAIQHASHWSRSLFQSPPTVGMNLVQDNKLAMGEHNYDLSHMSPGGVPDWQESYSECVYMPFYEIQFFLG